MRDPVIVATLASSVALLLLVPAFVGFAIDKLIGTAPLGLAIGAGAGVLLASAAVTRFVLCRIDALAPTDEREEPSE